MSIGTCILIILGLSFAGVFGNKQNQDRRYKSENRWSRHEQNQIVKNSQIFVIISLIIAISCISGAFVVIRTPQPPPPTVLQLHSNANSSTTTDPKPNMSQNDKLNLIPEEIRDVVSTSLTESTSKFTLGSVEASNFYLILTIILANLFVFSMIVNLLRRRNSNWRNTGWFASSIIIFLLLIGSLDRVNGQRRIGQAIDRFQVGNIDPRNVKSIKNLPQERQDSYIPVSIQPEVSYLSLKKRSNDMLKDLFVIPVIIFGSLFLLFLLIPLGLVRLKNNNNKAVLAGLLFTGIFFAGSLYNFRSVTGVIQEMETEPLERTAYEPDIYANNGIQPIPEKIQAEIRATLAQAKAKKSIQNSVSNKKPAKSEPIELMEYKLQSAPCATQEKARAEVEAKLRQVIAERLKQYNLTDESSIDSILTSLKPKTVIQESTKEVAGEKYPIYTGTIEIALGREFDRNMVRHFNSLSARNRYEWLMAGSVLAVIVLAMIDRLVLSSSKPATTA